MQKDEKQPSSASPSGYQTSEKLHSIKHEQTYSGANDGPQFPHHNNTSYTN